MTFLWLFSLLMLGSEDGAPLETTPLEGALWRGELRVEIKGPQFTQYLANSLNENGKPIGFTKEKGRLDLEYTLVIRFLINPLGEYSLVASHEIDGNYAVEREMRHTFSQEIFLKKQRTSYVENVQVSEKTLTRVRFEGEDEFAQDTFRFGSLRFLPSGRMDRKGQVEIIGEMTIPINGEGSRIFTRERQPESARDPNSRQEAEVKKTVLLPFVFSFTVDHRKDAVSGTFTIEIRERSPFPAEDAEDASKRRFRSALEGAGSFSMQPLFSKKKKKGK